MMSWRRGRRSRAVMGWIASAVMMMASDQVDW
jgi:hypothetical protein